MDIEKRDRLKGKKYRRVGRTNGFESKDYRLELQQKDKVT